MAACGRACAVTSAALAEGMWPRAAAAQRRRSQTEAAAAQRAAARPGHVLQALSMRARAQAPSVAPDAGLPPGARAVERVEPRRERAIVMAFADMYFVQLRIAPQNPKTPYVCFNKIQY
jgi:hypothetical protein